MSLTFETVEGDVDPFPDLSDDSFGDAWSDMLSDFDLDLSSDPSSELVEKCLWESMKRTGHWNAATRMYSCSEGGELGFDCNNDDCDHTHWVEYHCDNRVCPHCGESRAAQTFNNFRERVVDRLDLSRLRFTTLTFRNFGELTPDRLEAARECFHRLRRRDIWEQDGGLYAFECPYDPESGSWNLHIHVLTEGNRMRIGPDDGGCRNPEEHGVSECLVCTWREITSRVEGAPESHILDVQNMGDVCGNKAEVANYVTKYLTKNPELFDDSDCGLEERVRTLWQYHNTFHDANMVQTFGHCHHSSDHAVSLRWNPEFEFECPECGECNWMLRDGVLINGVTQPWWELKGYAGLGVG